MSREKYGFFVVEGQHDIAVIGKVLTLLGFSMKKQLDHVDPYWHEIFDGIQYPRRTKKGKQMLYLRLPIPYVYENENTSILIYPAERVDDVVEVLHRTLYAFEGDLQKITTLSLFCDADEHHCDQLFAGFLEELNSKNAEENVPVLNEFAKLQKPGTLSSGTPTTGIYIFPDNQQQGTLEILLDECGENVYAQLYSQANEYIDRADDTYKAKQKTSNKQKAAIGIVGNVFNPGSSNIVTIERDDWISEQTLDLPLLSQLVSYLRSILQL